MFDDDDPILTRLRSIALAMPEATGEDLARSPELPVQEGLRRLRRRGEGSKERRDHALVFCPDPGEKAALEQDDRFFVPAYYGPYGWLAIDLTDDCDWDEVAELLDASFRQIAPKRAIAQLPSEQSGE